MAGQQSGREGLEVKFVGDSAAIFNVDSLHLLAAVAGLDGLQVVAKKLACKFFGFSWALRQLNATIHNVVAHSFVREDDAFTAATCVDLAFHNDDR